MIICLFKTKEMLFCRPKFLSCYAMNSERVFQHFWQQILPRGCRKVSNYKVHCTIAEAVIIILFLRNLYTIAVFEIES